MVRKIAWAVVVALGAACAAGEGEGAGAGAGAGEIRGQGEGVGRTAFAEPVQDSRSRDERGVVLFLGTSLTAGYGVGAEAAYPAVIQAMIDSAGLPFRVVNAGLSGETSAGGLRRLEWSLQEPVAFLVVELGANDGLRGLSIEEMRRNLETIIQRTRERYPAAEIVIAGMEAPPNMGPDYTTAFRGVYPALAREYHAALVPFLLDGVAADPALNQEDRIHPNVQGQRRVAENVWRVLEPLLRLRISG